MRLSPTKVRNPARSRLARPGPSRFLQRRPWQEQPPDRRSNAARSPLCRSRRCAARAPRGVQKPGDVKRKPRANPPTASEAKADASIAVCPRTTALTSRSARRPARDAPLGCLVRSFCTVRAGHGSKCCASVNKGPKVVEGAFSEFTLSQRRMYPIRPGGSTSS